MPSRQREKSDRADPHLDVGTVESRDDPHNAERIGRHRVKQRDAGLGWKSK